MLQAAISSPNIADMNRESTLLEEIFAVISKNFLWIVYGLQVIRKKQSW